MDAIPQASFTSEVMRLPGFHFTPTDLEIVSCFLKPKLHHQPLPCDGLIHEAQIYSFHPNLLTNAYAPVEEDLQEWFFFSSIHSIQPGGTRASRRAGPGRWKSTQTKKEIRDRQGNYSGSKQIFNYFEDMPNRREHKSHWLMAEYTIEDLQGSHRKKKPVGIPTPTQDNKLRQCICKIYLSPRARSCSARSSVDSSSMSNTPLPMTPEDNYIEMQAGESLALTQPSKRRRVEEEREVPDAVTNSWSESLSFEGLPDWNDHEIFAGFEDWTEDEIFDGLKDICEVGDV